MTSVKRTLPATHHAFGRPRALPTILVGGGLAALLDGIDAVVFYYLKFGVTPAPLFQSIAGGVLGVRTFRGGSATMFLGILLHCSIAIGAAAVFYLVSLRVAAFLQRPFVYGPLFGLAVYAVMHYVVLPLSAVPPRAVPVPPVELVDLLIAHAMLVGLPIALMARRSASYA